MPSRSSISVIQKELLIMLSMLVLVCFFVFYKFIIGDAVYLFTDIGADSLYAAYPSYLNIAETLRTEGLPSWSFEQGLGQNLFPFSLNDPTIYFLYLLGSHHLAYGIVWTEIFKIIISGLLFFCYLKKLNLLTIAAYIGALLYAFSGFMVIGSTWCIFTIIGVYTALLLLSFEMLYQENKWWLFPIGIALLAIFNPVTLYTCSQFLLLYTIFRVFSAEKLNISLLPSLLIKMFFLGIVGILISAVMSLPALGQIFDSPRISGSASHFERLFSPPLFKLGDTLYMITLIMRRLSNDLLGNGSSFTGWWNYLDAPMSYCGLISLLLFTQVFQFLNRRQVIVYLLFLSIGIFAEIFPWFRRAFWMFQGDYFREFSLFISIIIILYAAISLDKIIRFNKFKPIWMIFGLAVLLLTLFSLYLFPLLSDSFFYSNTIVDGFTQIKVLFFLLLITFCLIFFEIKQYKQFAPLLLLITTLVEMSYFSYSTINDRKVVTTESLNQRTGYNDYTIEAINFIKTKDSGIYRIEKNYASSPSTLTGRNDAKVFHYFGSRSYHQFNQVNYVNFLSSLSLIDPTNENETRWIDGVIQSPVLSLLVGIKYVLIREDWSYNALINTLYKQIGVFENVKVLESKHSLPMGVAYDAYITQSDFAKLDKFSKQLALTKAIMVADNINADLSAMTKITERDIVPDATIDNLLKDLRKLKNNSLFITHFSNRQLSGTIANNIKQLVFFSFPFDRGWRASINGKPAPLLLVDGGLTGILVEPGINTISLTYEPPFVKIGAWLSLLGLLIYTVLIIYLKPKTK